MRILILSVLLAFCYGSPVKVKKFLPTARDNPFLNKIVGGQEATPHAYPYQISLQYKDFIIGFAYHTCGATIADSTHLVCAAHCIDGRNVDHFQVVAGAHNINWPESSKQKTHLEAMWKHESYNDAIITNDVSVLKLDKELVMDEFVQPLTLAAAGSDPAADTDCVNTGWGSTSHSGIPSMPNKLHVVTMPIVDRETCRQNYEGVNGVDEGMVCAGVQEGGISACSGDSGGPLACPDDAGNMELSGIVSWGMIPCGQEGRPSVFTSVGHFREWIDEHLAM